MYDRMIEISNEMRETVTLTRHKSKLRQSDVAIKSGLSVAKIQRIESGAVKTIAIDDFKKIYEALGLDTDELDLSLTKTVYMKVSTMIFNVIQSVRESNGFPSDNEAIRYMLTQYVNGECAKQIYYDWIDEMRDAIAGSYGKLVTKLSRNNEFLQKSLKKYEQYSDIPAEHIRAEVQAEEDEYWKKIHAKK